MDKELLEVLKRRQANNECAICGAKITFKQDPYRDYMPVTHSVVGEVLVETKHIEKGGVK